MRLRRLLSSAVLVTATTLATLPTAPATASHTEPGPLDRLLSPTVLDPVIALLAGLPTPYRPYPGDVCPGGDEACVDATIPAVVREMEDRLTPLAESCDHDAIFALAYLRVTENVKDAADRGLFDDRLWLTRVDAEFAEMYFDTMDRGHAGERVPRAWRIALDAAERRTMNGLGDFLLGMNAHINNDFPHVLEKVGLVAADGTSHKPDHNAYNTRLDELYHPVFAEMADRFDPGFDDYDIGPVDELVVSSIMRGWREMVWRHAEALAATRGRPVLRQVVEREIEEYAATQAHLVQAVPLFQAAASPTREEWCAAHG